MNFDLMRSHIAMRKPKNSKPTNISQEPGVKGVTRAKNPKIINTTPAVFLAREFGMDIFLNHIFQSSIIFHPSLKDKVNHPRQDKQPHERLDDVLGKAAPRKIRNELKIHD